MATEVKEKPIIFKADSVRAILAGKKIQTRRVITSENSRCWSPLEPGARWKFGKEDWSHLCWDDKSDEMKPRHDKDGVSVIYDSHGDGVWRRFKPTWEPGQLLWVREAFWAEHEMEGREYAESLDHGPQLGEDMYEHALQTNLPYCATPENPACPDEPGDFWEPPEDEQAEYKGDWPQWCPWSNFTKQSPLFMPKWASRLWLKVVSVRAQRVGDISIYDALAEGIEAEECTHQSQEVYGCTDCMNTGLLEDPTWAFEAAWDEINGKRGYPWKDDPWVWAFTFEIAERPNLWPTRKVEQTETA